MKLIVAIVSSFVSLFSGPTETVKERICGTWKGSYGTEYQIIDIIVKIDPQNKITVYNTDTEAYCIGSGTYRLLGDSAIYITCSLDDKKPIELTMYGHLNRTVSFMDGEWDTIEKEKQKEKEGEKGCFFLQKQPL